MAAKYQDYLAAQVLSEGQIISYRNLSRALQVHVNVAKRMLYEFHRIQSGKRPGSIHATYLICGARKPPEPKTNGVHHADGDVDMQDSLPPSSMAEPESSLPPSSAPAPEPDQDHAVDEVSIPTTTTITLVRQEELKAVKDSYSRIDAIHVYSLEPGPIEHVYLLSDCTRRVIEAQAKQDPLDSWKHYGTIRNPKAKRRTGARPPAPASAPAMPMTAGMKTAAKPAAGAPGAAQPAPKKDTSTRPSTSGTEGTKDEKSKPVSLNRESSSLFKSFAKTKAPDKTEKKPQSQDEEMADASEGSDDDLAPAPAMSEAAKEKAEAERQAKAERERTLKKMMEDDNDDEEEAKADEEDDEDEEMQDPDAEARAAAILNAKAEEAGEETKEVETAGGRRRGRRRVMKKKHFKDAEGYMVTKEEPAWESFSEDEVVPKVKKPAVTASNPVKSSGKEEKGKKGASKPGQGNIMSFFAKK